jgi:hypothetical protein
MLFTPDLDYHVALVPAAQVRDPAWKQGALGLWRTSDHALLKQFPLSDKHSIGTPTLSPDRRWLCFAQSRRRLEIWDVENEKRVQVLDSKLEPAAAFHPSDVIADTDGDGLKDGVEVAFGSNPTLATSTVSMFLTGSEVEFAARASTAMGLLAFSTGAQSGVTYNFVAGPGDAENSFFKLAGDGLQTKPAMLMIFGDTASVRVRATKGLVYLEQSFTLTIQHKMPDTLVLPVPPPGGIPDSADNFGGGYAGPFNNSGVAVSGSRMVVAAPGVQRAYVYDFAGESPGEPVLTLSSPTTGTVNSFASFFGRSVAMDGNLVVVGSEDGLSASPSHTGVVYVYDVTSATPEVPAFVLPNPVVTYANQYAASVAISGRRVVVSSPVTLISGGDAVGRVYVYDLDGASPTVPVATLQSPIETHDNRFGNDVAISGNRIAVGAYMDPPTTPPPPGRVYIYDWSGPVPVPRRRCLCIRSMILRAFFSRISALRSRWMAPVR